MRFTFLGGASEVGASATLLEVAGKRILVDAGIRMGKGGSPLPDLSLLQDQPLDAILLTHAHTDHIGALPLVHIGFPHVPILTTDPTKALCRVLMQDALKIMEGRWAQEEEVPLYPVHAVEGMLGRMATVPSGQPIVVAGDESLVATWIPSGHILGACSITLETPEGTVLFAGDYSLDKQQTVDGMTLPQETPDVMITESTYGNRFHANRDLEENRLVKRVAEVVGKGGKVLIPAFALGRAQEVVLLLLEAMRRRQIPRFPVYVDGMVRSMCRVYADHPQYLRESLRKSIAKSGNPFFFDGGAVSVMANQREKIAAGVPCAIVASSGMLTGGASMFYAERLSENPLNSIMMTGYQDEESPGHELLRLADEVKASGEGFMRMAGVTRRVTCQVEKYGLSAHADAGQMLGVVCRMAPKHVILVHGDAAARTALSTTFPPEMKVHLPANGDSIELAPFRRPKKSKAATLAGIGGGEALDLARLRAALVKRDGTGRRYTLRELAQAWYGRVESVEELRAAILEVPHLFPPDAHRPFLFGLTGGFVTPKREGPALADPAAVIRRGREIFSGLPGFVGVAAVPEDRRATVTFEFPDRAREAFQAQFVLLASETGWTVQLSPKASHKALTDQVREVIPLIWEVLKVSIFPHQARVLARVRTLVDSPSEEDLAAAQARYLDLTGRELELEKADPPVAPAQLITASGRMEINVASRLIKSGFAERGVALLRCSQKMDPEPLLELGFISPQAGERHQDLVDVLAAKTGWILRIRPEANQVALSQRALQLLPAEWRLKGPASVLSEQRLVRFKAPALAAQPQLVEKASAQLEMETGYRVAVEFAKK